MVKCQYCNREMTTAAGCRYTHYGIDGKTVKRLKVGQGPHDGWMQKGDRCHDCGAKYGYQHHPGCDNEFCPICGLQVIGPCSCNIQTLSYETTRRD